MNWSGLLGVDPKDEGVQHLDENTSAQRLRKNEILIHQDAPVPHVYLVKSGLLQAKFVSFEGAEVWLANLGPGAIVGEISALCSRLSSSNVEAAEPTEVLLVPQKVFLDALSRSSKLALAVASMLAGRIADTSTSLTSHVALKIEYRLMNALKTMAERGQRGEDLKVARAPSMLQLAVRIHASREATSRAYAKLLKRGVLIKKDGALYLRAQGRTAPV
ncbi:MAG: Crp/Fnr family transcriptional regulator [Henriciella sp.]